MQGFAWRGYADMTMPCLYVMMPMMISGPSTLHFFGDKGTTENLPPLPPRTTYPSNSLPPFSTPTPARTPHPHDSPPRNPAPPPPPYTLHPLETSALSSLIVRVSGLLCQALDRSGVFFNRKVASYKTPTPHTLASRRRNRKMTNAEAADIMFTHFFDNDVPHYSI